MSGTTDSGPAWRVEPIPGRLAYRDENGRTRIPVWLVRNGRHVADTDIVLLPSEATLLRDQLTATNDENCRDESLLFPAQQARQAGDDGMTVVPYRGTCYPNLLPSAAMALGRREDQVATPHSTRRRPHHEHSRSDADP